MLLDPDQRYIVIGSIVQSSRFLLCTAPAGSASMHAFSTSSPGPAAQVSALGAVSQGPVEPFTSVNPSFASFLLAAAGETTITNRDAVVPSIAPAVSTCAAAQ